MKDFPIIWLLFNTKTGKVILGLFGAFVVVSLVGWWLVPIIAALIGAFILYDYSVSKGNKKRSELITGICFFAFAVLFSLFYVFHVNRERYFPKDSPSYEPMEKEDIMDDDTSTWEPPADTAFVSASCIFRSPLEVPI